MSPLKSACIIACVAASAGGLGFTAGGMVGVSRSDPVLAELRKQRTAMEALEARVTSMGSRWTDQCSQCAAQPAAQGEGVQQAIREVLDERSAREKSAQAAEQAMRALPAEEVAAASQRMGAVLNQAIATRHWTGNNAAEMRRLKTRVSEEEMRLALQRFSEAVNGGQLTVDFPGPPF